MNTFIGNIQSNINHLYRLVKKRDLPLFLSEQEWRINHRYSGKRIMDKLKMYISIKTNVTFKQINNCIFDSCLWNIINVTLNKAIAIFFFSKEIISFKINKGEKNAKTINTMVSTK